LEERLAGWRDANPAADPMKNGLTELVFEQQDLAADGRLRDVQLLTRSREGAGFGDGPDDLELPEVHASSGYICRTHGFNGTDVSGRFQSPGRRRKVALDGEGWAEADASGRLGGEDRRDRLDEAIGNRVVTAVDVNLTTRALFLDVGYFPACSQFAIAPDNATTTQRPKPEEPHETHFRSL
jgi:hypothetical protein